jgi:hypothetical protein
MRCAESTTTGRSVIITINFVLHNEDLNEYRKYITLRRQDASLISKIFWGEVSLHACTHVLIG